MPAPRPSARIHASPRLAAAAASEPAAVLADLDSSPQGLSATEAARRLAIQGPNTLGGEEREPAWRVLTRAAANPLVILLVLLTVSEVVAGDAEAVSRRICHEVGIDTTHVVRGDEVDALDDATLAAAAGRATLAVRLDPAQKERIVRLLRSRGHVVGFLGDGVNDAPALKAADVGISVDTAADIARESADCILLDKDLRVLRDGVEEGRKVFANILKEIRMGASSNFGNVLSVLGASVLLPFVPMTPLQILTLNLLYDCSQVPIPGDAVDPELVARAALFHTGWFVESLVTQALVIHVIRTNRIPFLESRASPALAAATVAVILVGLWLPVSPLGPLLGFVPLPGGWWPVLGLSVAAYVFVVHVVKTWLVRRGWID